MPDPSQPQEVPEPIFENIVAEKYPDVYQQNMQPEEVPAEISSASEVERPAADILNQIPEPPQDDGRQKYIFIAVIVIFFFVLFALLYTIFFRRSGSTTAVVPVTLTYWGLWEEELIYRPIFDEYTKTNSHVTIKYEMKSPKDYLTFLKARSKSGQGPDIYRFHNTWLPQLVTTSESYLQKVPKDIYSDDEYAKTFHAVHQDDLGITVGKSVDYYGIPLYADTLMLIYNDDMFKKAAISLPPSQWIDEFGDVTRRLSVISADGKTTTSGVAMGTVGNVEHYSDIYGVLTLLNAIPKGTTTLTRTWSLSQLKNTAQAKDNGNAQQALQAYRGFAEQKYWTPTMPNSVDAFAQGKVAMIFAYTWQIPIIKAKNPSISLKVAPLPQGFEGRRVTLASYWAEGVSPQAKPERQREAWKLLKYLSQKETLQKIYESQTKARGLGMLPSRTDMLATVKDHPILKHVAAQLPYAVSLPVVTRTYDAGLNDELSKYIENAINSAQKGVSYASAVTQIAPGIQQTLKKYGLE